MLWRGLLGHSSHTYATQPHHHRRIPRWSDLRAAVWRWQGVCRIGDRLSPRPWLSAETQGDLWGRRVPDTPLPLRPAPPRWAHHLAAPVHDRWQSTGVFDGARAPGQPSTVSTSSHACRAVWGGSRRRASAHIRLDAQPAHLHLGTACD